MLHLKIMSLPPVEVSNHHWSASSWIADELLLVKFFEKSFKSAKFKGTYVKFIFKHAGLIWQVLNMLHGSQSENF